MGVPAFFRWLSKKYPSIVVHCVEERQKVINEVKIPTDSSLPNPNNVEFDNLYLDMNGIIHPCCHPEDKPAPKDENEMMIAIFEYIDRLFNIVRPRRLLYMAIDGVAPRAKMNQQRSRRFRASKETAEKIDEIEIFRRDLLDKGASLPPPKPKEEHFDSNCITPGTPFMARLAQCLHYYIHDRLNSDPGWKNIKVILSDANVPGEGEHKIMDFIRRQRGNPDHDPNTRHCLCGADADLIMLGLATHEPNFTIIREEFKPSKPRNCELCGQIGHEMKECTGLAKEKQGDHDELEKAISSEQEFIFLRLNVLREYLEKELTMHHLPFPFDLERAIDDWVFMCFFVGNDFLPHLPSLEIRENAIDRLIKLYQKTVYKTGGFLTDSGKVHLERVQLILTDLGEVEDEIFKRRQENEVAFRQRQKDRNKRQKFQNAGRPAWVPSGQFAPNPIGNTPSPVVNARQEAYQMRVQGMHTNAQRNLGNLDAAQALKAMLREDSTDPKKDEDTAKGEKRKWEKTNQSDEEEEPVDEVRLWEDGWKDRYYVCKFDVKIESTKFRQQVAAAYCEGLSWVLRYYYQGCASWKWFFPYHYAPFASDFSNIGDLPDEFETGTQPFKPLEQLMGVFPAASKQHLPNPFAELMIDPESSIIDFYPDNFKIDLNGKKFAWQGVALLPFVDEQRLLNAVKDVYPLLTPAEQKRNVRGDDRLYIGKHCTGFNFLVGLYEGERDFSQEVPLVTNLFEGIGGIVLLTEVAVDIDGVVKSTLQGLPDIHDNQVVCVRYRDPHYPEDHIFPAKRLPGAVDPPKVLRPEEMCNTDRRNWRPQIGMAPATQRAYVDISGHRKLGHSFRQEAGTGVYSNTPPPNSQSYPNRGYGGQQRYGDRNQGYRGGGGGGGGGRGYGGNQYQNQGRSANSGYGGGYGGGSHSRSSSYPQYGGSSSSSNYGQREGGYGSRQGGGNSGYQQRYQSTDSSYSRYNPYQVPGSQQTQQRQQQRSQRDNPDQQQQQYFGSNTYHYQDQKRW